VSSPGLNFVLRYVKGVQDKIHFRFLAIWQKMATADHFSVVKNIRNNIMIICVASLCIKLCTVMIVTVLDCKNSSFMVLSIRRQEYAALYGTGVCLFARGINTSLFHCCNKIIYIICFLFLLIII
jgi:hypothetical protein